MLNDVETRWVATIVEWLDDGTRRIWGDRAMRMLALNWEGVYRPEVITALMTQLEARADPDVIDYVRRLAERDGFWAGQHEVSAAAKRCLATLTEIQTKLDGEAALLRPASSDGDPSTELLR